MHVELHHTTPRLPVEGCDGQICYSLVSPKKVAVSQAQFSGENRVLILLVAHVEDPVNVSMQFEIVTPSLTATVFNLIAAYTCYSCYTC